MLPDRVELGNANIFQFLSYSQITDQTPSIQELSKRLSSFNFLQVLVNLMRMGLTLSRSEDLGQRYQTEQGLRAAFCPPCCEKQIQSQDLNQSFIFHRFAVLRLLLESCHVSQPDSARNVSEPDERHNLGECVLMMNDFLVPEVEEKPLFSLPLDPSEWVNERAVPEELKFDEENELVVNQNPLISFLLSESDCIRFAKVGNEWPVEDGERLYSVRRAEGKIDVYDDVEVRKHLLVEYIQCFEYANKSHNIPEKMVRSKELLSLAQDSKIDIQAEFSEATGLTLKEYQYLIFHALANYLKMTPEDAGQAKWLSISPRPPHLEDLYDKLLKHNYISIDELPNEIYDSFKSTPMNEFRVFRDKPLVKTGENEMICIDFNFLIDKLESGIFWIIFNQLKESDRGQLFGIWGKAFEKYVGSILKRSVSNMDGETEDSIEVFQGLISSPKYKDNPDHECTDFIIYTDETLVLIECKGGRLTADAKYNGKFYDLETDLKKKFVAGVRQLKNAIVDLANKNKGKRRHIEGVDISKIKKIYPVLIVWDETFSAPLMNWYLDWQLKHILKRSDIPLDLEVAPLSVMTSLDLEYLEPYLTDTRFHKHLDNWIEFYQQNRAIPTFRLYVPTLRNEDLRRNQYMKQQFDQIKSDISCFFAQPANLFNSHNPFNPRLKQNPHNPFNPRFRQ